MDWTGIKKDARTFTKAEKRKIDKLDPKKFVQSSNNLKAVKEYIY